MFPFFGVIWYVFANSSNMETFLGKLDICEVSVQSVPLVSILCCFLDFQYSHNFLRKLPAVIFIVHFLYKSVTTMITLWKILSQKMLLLTRSIYVKDLNLKPWMKRYLQCIKMDPEWSKWPTNILNHIRRHDYVPPAKGIARLFGSITLLKMAIL